MVIRVKPISITKIKITPITEQVKVKDITLTKVKVNM